MKSNQYKIRTITKVADVTDLFILKIHVFLQTCTQQHNQHIVFNLTQLSANIKNPIYQLTHQYLATNKHGWLYTYTIYRTIYI